MKRLLKYFSFSNCISVRGQIFSIYFNQNNVLHHNAEADLKKQTQLSFIKPDIKCVKKSKAMPLLWNFTLFRKNIGIFLYICYYISYMLFMLTCTKLIFVIFKWINIFNFSPLYFNVVNIDRYNPHKQIFWGVLNCFWECQGVLLPKYLRTSGLDQPRGSSPEEAPSTQGHVYLFFFNMEMINLERT